MKVSVAIAALNEGRQLRATIECILASSVVPDEIVVYDDCGELPADVSHLDRTRVIRGSARVGSGPAKHAAAAACSGDLVVVMDGHCRPAFDWLEHIADESRRAPEAILCPVCTGIESASYRNGAFRGMGGKLVFDEPTGFWAVRWTDCRPGVHSYSVPTVVGGCYAIPRGLLDRMGGYAPGYFGYGVEEEFLGLRAWLVGGECRVVPRAVVGHWFNRTFSRRTSDGSIDKPWEQHFNRHVAAQVCFEESVYERVYLPRLTRYGTDPEMLQKLASRASELLLLRSHVQKNRVMKDAALEEWCGVRHPG